MKRPFRIKKQIAIYKRNERRELHQFQELKALPGSITAINREARLLFQKCCNWSLFVIQLYKEEFIIMGEQFCSLLVIVKMI